MPLEQARVVEPLLPHVEPAEQEFPADEIDAALIEERFANLANEEVTLLATNLARPDGFIKTLIMGSLITSKELIANINSTFVRTHRGYYKTWPPTYDGGANSYLSFKIGCPDLDYTSPDSQSGSSKDKWKDGLGFAFIAEQIISLSNTVVNYGNFGLYSHKRNLLEEGKPLPPELAAMTDEEFLASEQIPSKSDFIKFTHMARQYRTLHNNDQGELNIKAQEEVFPKVDLKQGIIFIPLREKSAIKQLILTTISESLPFADQILEAYGIDIKSLTPEAVLNQYPNIYWYPQQNIDLAIKYLSTHPERIEQIIGQNNKEPII